MQPKQKHFFPEATVDSVGRRRIFWNKEERILFYSTMILDSFTWV
jgi:hypothetical protein